MNTGTETGLSFSTEGVPSQIENNVGIEKTASIGFKQNKRKMNNTAENHSVFAFHEGECLK